MTNKIVDNLMGGLDDMSYHTLVKKITIKDTAKFTQVNTEETKNGKKK